MKLLRYGPPNQEKPGLLDSEGGIRDLSGHIDDISLDTAGQGTPVRGGDILRVFSILPKFDNAVVLRGNVANPGRYGWHAGMKLSDLIPDAQSLLTREYWKQRARLGCCPGREPLT